MKISRRILIAGALVGAAALGFMPTVQYVRYRVALGQLYERALIQNITVEDPRDGALTSVTANEDHGSKTLRVESYTPFQRSLAPGNPYYTTTQFVDRGADGLGIGDLVCEITRLPEDKKLTLCLEFDEISPHWQRGYQREYRETMRGIARIVNSTTPTLTEPQAPKHPDSDTKPI